MNLSFAGCGFLGIYHVGVAVCFKKYAPHLLLDKISGASAGAIAACCLLCDLPLGTMVGNVLKLVKEARRKTLGPFSPSFNYLPDDAHIRVSGKLHISLTRVYDGQNVIVSQFNSREDLLQALLASSFVPIFSGLLPPRFHGIRYMDGGFSDNLPTLDDNTVTISPFSGESDICPRDISSQLFHVNFANTSIELSRQNIYRLARILFPPNPEILSKMCQQGFDDALRFLHRNNLINCNRCVSIQSTFVISETLDDNTEYDPECVECKMHRQEALVADLPETVMKLFQDAIDSANKGIINWLFKHKSMKLLSVLSLPYTFPVDLIMATLYKFIESAPKLSENAVKLIKCFLKQIALLLPTINIQFISIPEMIKYQIAISNYKSSYTDKDEIDSFSKSWKNYQHNSCFLKIRDFSHTDDTFENILQVTSDQEALMAYYYLNDNNTVKMKDIFDIKSSDYNEIFETTKQLQFDEVSWDEPDWLNKHKLTDVIPEVPQKNIKSEDNREDDQRSLEQSDGSHEETNIFSDPESEWTMKKTIESVNVPSISTTSSLRPETYQPNQ
ncbi:1-acylglycerol-3-phosphate O-acyltransferase Pnpla3 isoform X2 [Chelonus insularis]|uniref:1-acylglycerol-3-phosphate O-acyltransferase Pnpla3 isoform X2 n=1 Tax=Chelonus insularis TaxID=460826 RepID=UPI00158CC4F0|nr:1-acylglycerol-3-phosphate O-acyltransferase Pnpla3 isoform X2 [Chelonus insularis]